VIYLNNAAEGWPKAPGVAAAVANALERPSLSPGRTAGDATNLIAECRERIAHLLGTPDPSRIVLTANGTLALNLAILGILNHSRARPSSPLVVITTVAEHNSVLRPLFRLECQQQVRVLLIGFDVNTGLDLPAFERALSEKPALVAINHASNVTGRINPVARFFALAQQAGAITLLDASQTVGHMPVLPLELGADLVAFPGQKGLHGPAGAGVLYVASGMDLEQTIVGGTGRHSESRSHPSAMPERMEAGTPGTPAIAGLNCALAWHQENADDFRYHFREASRRLREGLRSLPKVRIVDDSLEEEYLGVVSFKVDGWPVEDVGAVLLESFGVACRTGLHCAPLMHEALGTLPEGTVRLSVSGLTTSDDISAAIAAIAKLPSR
jgi:cysteine desulfurase / selenocysteine lyase